MNDLLGLVLWHVAAGSLAAFWTAPLWSRNPDRGNVIAVKREEWVDGPGGRVELDGHGWPVGTEKWRA